MKEQFAIPCVGAIIYKMENNEIHLVLQTRQKENGGLENGLFEIPAGKIREYENIFNALKREIQEETGLTITKIIDENLTYYDSTRDFETQSFTPFCITQNLSGGYSIILHTFLCKATGKVVNQTNETTNISWVPLSKVIELLNNNKETFFPMHINALRKFVSAIEKFR